MSDFIRVVCDDACYQARIQLCAILERVVQCNSVIYAYANNAHVTNEAFTFLRNIKTNDPLVDIYLSAVKECCYKSELQVGFGTKFICTLIINLINCMQHKNLSHMHDVHMDNLHAFVETIVNDGIIPNRQQFEIAVENIVNDIGIRDNVINALNQAGLNGSVHISNDIATNDSISIIDGYVFNVISHFHRFNEQTVQLYGCKSLLIDGIIEQVSEIHNLLERFSKEKEPFVIFALGFGEEVLQTLETNYKRRILRVYPVQVPSEINSINLLNDLAVVIGSRFISSLQGEIIQMADYDSLKPVDMFSLSTGKITIKNNITAHNVAMHVTELRQRAMQTDVYDLNQLLLKRIRALTSQYVNVRLAANSQQEHLQKRESMSQALRYATSIINSGVYRNTHNTNNKLLKALNNLPNEYFSVNALLYAGRLAVAAVELLQSIDAACVLA